jgi:hypothetical protein
MITPRFGLDIGQVFDLVIVGRRVCTVCARGHSRSRAWWFLVAALLSTGSPSRMTREDQSRRLRPFVSRKVVRAYSSGVSQDVDPDADRAVVFVGYASVMLQFQLLELTLWIFLSRSLKPGMNASQVDERWRSGTGRPSEPSCVASAIRTIGHRNC